MNVDGVFLVTRPVQYVTARNLAMQLGLKFPVIIIQDGFPGARKLLNSIKAHDSYWSSCYISGNRFLLPLVIHSKGLSNVPLYVDSDLYKDSVINFLSSPFSKVKLFEEGFYSYVTDQTSHMVRNGKSLRYLIYAIFALPKGLGYSRWTDSVYLYRPNASKLNKTLGIEKDFMEYCNDYFSIICKVFDLEFDFSCLAFDKKTSLSLYCSGPDVEVVKRNVKNMDFDIVKLHPALASLDEEAGKSAFVWKESNVPIELIVILLLQKFNTIKFYHENSTAVLYLQTLKSCVECLNIGSYVEGYDAEFEAVREFFSK